MSYLEFQETWEKEIKDARKRVLIWERPFLPDIPDVDKLSEEVVVEEVRKLTPYIKRAKKRPLSWLNGLLRFVLTFIPIVLLVCDKEWILFLESARWIGGILCWIVGNAYVFSTWPGLVCIFPVVLYMVGIFSAIFGSFLAFPAVLLIRIVFEVFSDSRLRAYLNWFYIKIPYNL